MKLTAQIIQVEMETIANKFFLIFLLFLSCKSSEVPVKETQELYNVIELEEYSKDGLYFKTIPFESMSYGRPLSYKGITEYNYKKIGCWKMKDF